MPALELEAADGCGRISLPAGETVIGRGPFLGIADKRVSRNHGVLEVVGEKLRIRSVHVNPCFYQPSHKKQFLPLEKDKWQWLEEGDSFSLLPDKFVFKVVASQPDIDCTLSNSQNIDVEIEENELESTSEVHEGSKVEKEKPCSTSHTVCKAQLPSANWNKGMQQTKPIQRKRDLPPWMLQEGLDIRPLSDSPAKGVARRRKCKMEQKTPEECPEARKRLSPSEDSVRTEECEKEHQTKSRIKIEQTGRAAALKEAPSFHVSKDTDNSEISNKSTELQSTKSPTEDEICQSKNELLEHNQTRKPQLPFQMCRRQRSDSKTQEGLDESRPAPHHELPQSPVHSTDEQYMDASCSPSGQVGGSVYNEDTSQGSTQTSNKRIPCVYGQQCYRKNPVHFQQFSHPGDSDFDDTSKESQEDNDERPECPYGTDCYRKNPQHKLEYKHTKPPRADPVAVGPRLVMWRHALTLPAALLLIFYVACEAVEALYCLPWHSGSYLVQAHTPLLQQVFPERAWCWWCR
ncbi:aprataxin and PNK-like factor isoform X2 [Pleurodeles waltl]|uniref:aprataxin and PNK-like factor isoform X2 n=1 Tax=Pleurodeles waltl TaxID=8319 RepID=UPI0037098111